MHLVDGKYRRHGGTVVRWSGRDGQNRLGEDEHNARWETALLVARPRAPSARQISLEALSRPHQP